MCDETLHASEAQDLAQWMQRPQQEFKCGISQERIQTRQIGWRAVEGEWPEVGMFFRRDSWDAVCRAVVGSQHGEPVVFNANMAVVDVVRCFRGVADVRLRARD